MCDVLFYIDTGAGEENGPKDESVSAVQSLQCAVPGCSNIEASCSDKSFFHFPVSEDRLVRF
jgi:hypothetical protein